MHEPHPPRDSDGPNHPRPRALLRQVSDLPHSALGRALAVEHQLEQAGSHTLHALTHRVADLPHRVMEHERGAGKVAFYLPHQAVECVIHLPHYALRMERRLEDLSAASLRTIKHSFEPYESVRQYRTHQCAAVAATLPDPSAFPSIESLAGDVHAQVTRITSTAPAKGFLAALALYAGLGLAGHEPIQTRLDQAFRQPGVQRHAFPDPAHSLVPELSSADALPVLQPPALEDFAKEVQRLANYPLRVRDWGQDVKADAAVLSTQGFPVTPMDLVYAARVLYFEGASDPLAGNDMPKIREGFRGLAAIIIRRWQTQEYGKTPYDVVTDCTPTVQFNCIPDNPGFFTVSEIRQSGYDVVRRANKKALMDEERAHLAYDVLVEGIVSQLLGTFTQFDPTNGAEFYRNPSCSAYDGFWASLERTADINSHRFYRRKTHNAGLTAGPPPAQEGTY